jgi:ankyrin repeat protein
MKRSSPFLDLIRAIVDDEFDAAEGLLRERQELAITAAPIGATRQESLEHFFPEISHYLYGGDTALHIAAAACSFRLAELLVSCGADPRARNRRGAEPLHYAADGNQAEPAAQGAMVTYLVSIGADPISVDKSGVAPLHRAVRRRSLSAVRALLEGGASAGQRNRSGSTPLHLAVQNTGASGSGSDTAREQQAEIIKLLLEHGAKLTDRDRNGKTPIEAAASEWIREMLLR